MTEKRQPLQQLYHFIKYGFPQFIPITIALIAGLSIGLVGGFLIAWLLCLKLLAILVLIPLGPYP